MTVTSPECNIVSNVFRKGMQNPVLVLDDEEGVNVTTAELENLSSVFNEESSHGPTAINVENSKDVIIGPVTQFHGPVTIYHTNGVSKDNSVTVESKTAVQNGKLVKSESTSSDSSPGVEKSNTIYLPRSRRLIYAAVTAVTAIVIVVILCSVMLSASKREDPTTSTMKYDTTAIDYYETDSKNSNNVLEPVGTNTLISREMWGAPENNNTQPLQHPTPLVIICHTATSHCSTYTECVKKVAAIRNYSVNKLDMSDIKYNFLIGGDGKAYVGRGWDTQNEIAGNSVSIAFIGNYIDNHLPENMAIRAKVLIQDGVEKRKLAKNYKVVCHNQTAPTESPGRYVYTEVKTWFNFDSSSYIYRVRHLGTQRGTYYFNK